MENTFNEHFSGDHWLHDLFDHAKDLIQIVRIDGIILYVNQTWATLLGYNREEILGKSLYTYIAEEDQALYKGFRHGVITGQHSGRPIVFRLKAKDSRTISVEGNISVKKEGDEPLYTRGIFRDITARLQHEAQLRQLNQELKEREENLRQLLIHAPDAVIVITRESRISFWNPKAEQLFGWRSEEVLHQLLQHFIIPPQYREAHEKGMRRYLSTGEGPVLNKTIEITAIKKSSEEFYVSLTISPTSQNGETAFISFIRDITQQKENQLALERKTQELEQFTHVSHHDLQEPLRKITMFTEMVYADQNNQLTEVSRQRLEKVSSAARRMSTALQDVLDYASLNREETATEVDLNKVLAAVQQDLELVISEKGAKITVHSLFTVKAIPGQMHQLFYNLLSNALKFSKTSEPPSINITCEKLDAGEVPKHTELNYGKQYCQITVQDNGIGFQPDATEKIFGMFQRLHSKEAYAGTGIGLALVKKVVENHQGHIRATSEPGKGATFRILLPMVSAD